MPFIQCPGGITAKHPAGLQIHELHGYLASPTKKVKPI